MERYSFRRTSVQLQIILNSDYLPDYLSVSYDHGIISFLEMMKHVYLPNMKSNVCTFFLCQTTPPLVFFYLKFVLHSLWKEAKVLSILDSKVTK